MATRWRQRLRPPRSSTARASGVPWGLESVRAIDNLPYRRSNPRPGPFLVRILQPGVRTPCSVPGRGLQAQPSQSRSGLQRRGFRTISLGGGQHRAHWAEVSRGRSEPKGCAQSQKAERRFPAAGPHAVLFPFGIPSPPPPDPSLLLSQVPRCALLPFLLLPCSCSVSSPVPYLITTGTRGPRSHFSNGNVTLHRPTRKIKAPVQTKSLRNWP